MKAYSKLVYGLSAVLFVVLVYCGYEYMKYSSRQKPANENRAALQEDLSIKQALSNLIDQEIAQYELCDSVLKGDRKVLNQLIALSKEEPIFVFRFDEFACEVCIESAFRDLDSMPELSKSKRVYVIANCQNRAMWKALLNEYGDKYNLMNIEYGSRLFLKDKNDELPPCFFVLENGSLAPKKLFFYLKEIPELNKKYFKMISDELAAKQKSR